MRILFASLQGLNLLEGGTKTQVLLLKKYLEDLGVEVSLFQEFSDFKLEDYSLFHLFAAEGATFHLGRLLKSLGMRMVVSPIFYSRHAPFTLRLLNSPFLLLRRFYGVWTEPIYVKELCTMADLVVPNTGKEKDLLIKGLGIKEKKVKVIPNGVEERFYYAEPDLFFNTYHLKDFILYTGHIGWGRKNLLRLLKVLERLKEPAVLIGKVIPTEYGKRCLAIVQRCPWIKVIDHLPHTSPLLQSAYASCSVFVLPSFYETPGLSALEAGLAGAKVVITKYGGTEEYYGRFATYINPYSERSIEEGIKEALSKKRSDDLREHIRKNFLWPEIAKRLLLLYKSLDRK
ncbi:MAG: glycosyltransferase family 4 protein [candidate division WOR-3 bacterium]